MDFSVIIPARFASTRLPGKPLREIRGKPLLHYVWDCAMQSQATRVLIATDDERIRHAAESFGATVCMTSSTHSSGTERLAEVAKQMGFGDGHIVVNLQGDEPLIPASLIDQVASNLHLHEAACMATLCERLLSAAEVFNPNICKVVMDSLGFALYFSRAPIPWDRARFASDTQDLDPHAHYFRHIGLYAYRAGFLQEYVRWPACAGEELEALEQLRVLWNGGKIHVAEACDTPGPGVDTEDDLARVALLLASVPSGAVLPKQDGDRL